MPDFLRIDARAMDALINKIKKAPDDIRQAATSELKLSTNEMAANAKLFAPANTGFLRNSIGSEPAGDLSFEVFAAKDYAAYVEFGTGTEVFATDLYSFAEEEKEYAENFFVNGKGHMPPHPYFFRAVTQEEPKMMERLTATLDEKLLK